MCPRVVTERIIYCSPWMTQTNDHSSAEDENVTYAYVLDAVVRLLDVPPLDFQDDPAKINNIYVKTKI